MIILSYYQGYVSVSERTGFFEFFKTGLKIKNKTFRFKKTGYDFLKRFQKSKTGFSGFIFKDLNEIKYLFWLYLLTESIKIVVVLVQNR